MKQNKTLHQIAQRLKRKELIKYASNLHIEFDEKWDTSKLCEVYTQYILFYHIRKNCFLCYQRQIWISVTIQR